MGTSEKQDTRQQIHDAARACLLADGFAALSTRKIAEAAGVPLSQIHYHLGSREEMVLGLLRAENDRLLERQTATFATDLPLAEQWAIACDYLDDDLDSGFVRIMQEMTTAGWSSAVVGDEVRLMVGGWTAVLTDVARRAEKAGLHLGGFGPEEIAALTSAVFLGAESLILLGMESKALPLRKALRSIGRLIADLEGSRPS